MLRYRRFPPRRDVRKRTEQIAKPEGQSTPKRNQNNTRAREQEQMGSKVEMERTKSKRTGGELRGKKGVTADHRSRAKMTKGRRRQGEGTTTKIRAGTQLGLGRRRESTASEQQWKRCENNQNKKQIGTANNGTITAGSTWTR